MDCGDISMFIHEHYSYFTKRTLELSLLVNELEPIVLRKSSFGGSLYCIAQLCASPFEKLPNGLVRSESEAQFSQFIDRSECNLQRFKKAITEWQEKDGMVGIYCPARALNALFKCNITTGMRFFDDNLLLQKKYYPEFDIPIESYEDLKKSPIKNILIMSHSFFGAIAEKCMN